MTFLTVVRLAVAGFSVAAVQALLIDRWPSDIVRHLDLPLAVAIALTLARPAAAPVVGFVFGIMVDAFQLRLFGLHGLAYCALGPLAANLPLGSLRSRTEIVAYLTAVLSIVVTGIVLVGAWLVDGSPVPGTTGRLVQVGLWSVMIGLPLTNILGGRVGLAVPDGVTTVAALGSAATTERR